MLKRIRLFGVRKRINEIVDHLNDEEILDISPIFDSINERLDNAVWLFGTVFRYIAEVKERVAKMKKRLDVLDKRNTQVSALLFVRRRGAEMDSEMLIHALEKIEEMEERILSLESELSPRSETEEDNGQSDEN